MHKIQSVIFDFDGVIIDSEILYIKSIKEYLASYGVTISEEECTKIFSGLPTITTYKHAEALINSVPGNNITLDHDVYFEGVVNILTEKKKTIFISKDVDTLIKHLASANIPFGIASSSSKKVILKTLTQVSLINYFPAENIFSAVDVGKYKPDPAVYLAALEGLKFNPSNTIVIEDSRGGVLAAKAAGLFTIGYCGASHCFSQHEEMLIKAGADKIFHDMLDIKDFINRNPQKGENHV